MNKKLLIAMTITYTSIACTFIACQKEESISKSLSSQSASKTRSAQLEASVGVSFDAGHPSSQCHGQGACFNGTPNYFAHWVHIPCQGPGKECHWDLSISLSKFKSLKEDEPKDIEMSLVNYSDSEFLIPDRSILVQETNQYLNIPTQVLQRNEDGTYLFKNVVISNTPKYINE